MELGIIDLEKLMTYLLPQTWQSECEIFIKDDKIKICHVPSNAWLRHSKGPKTGTDWDIYGDDFLNKELALIELSKAPAPPRNKGELGILEFSIEIPSQPVVHPTGKSLSKNKK